MQSSTKKLNFGGVFGAFSPLFKGIEAALKKKIRRFSHHKAFSYLKRAAVYASMPKASPLQTIITVMKSFLFAVLVLVTGSVFAATPADIARANARAQAAAARANAMSARQARPAARGTAQPAMPRQAAPVRHGGVRPGMHPY